MNLDAKIKIARQIIKQASERYPSSKMAVTWTGGKDSTTILHLIKTTFGKIPFPVMFNDSTMEFEEVYDFIENLTQKWQIDLKIVPHLKKDLEKFYAVKNIDEKKRLARIMKINAINWALKKYEWQAFIVGIRWDEHQSRSKEKPFSKRPDHTRIHPILQFTEKDIWDYIKKFKVPYVNLYDHGYRSLGEKPFTKPAKKGGGERSGREQDKEKLMTRLRDLGYW